MPDVPRAGPGREADDVPRAQGRGRVRDQVGLFGAEVLFLELDKGGLGFGGRERERGRGEIPF